MSLAKASDSDIYEAAADRVYGESLEVMEGVQMFWRLMGDEALESNEPPAEWVDEYGPDRALKLFRLAKAGMLTKQEAPMGVHVAMAHAAAVMKAKASKNAEKGHQTLNIGTMVQFPGAAELYPGAPAGYPTREVDDDE